MLLAFVTLLPPPHTPGLLLPSRPRDTRISLRCPTPRRRVRGGVACRAELAQDAPYAAAIGACLLSSLVFVVPRSQEGNEDDAEGMVDTRLGVMAIISIVPYFNWLTWVFAWLDTQEWRYLVYSAVYLAPYLRTTNLLLTEESWLPIASILLCVIHVQLEISIRNGDVEGFSYKLFSKEVKKDQQVSKTHKKVIEKDPDMLPSAKDEAKEKLKDWEIPCESSSTSKQSNEGEDTDKDGGW